MHDDQIAQLIQEEAQRQREGLELIPSENYVSADVLTAMGSIFTNKYSEGYPGKRYYGGQDFTDPLERLAIDRAKQLFNADHANVQPHSGVPANEAVYYAWLEPGDTVLAMDLGHGGHLSHGNPMTRSAHIYNFVPYKMKDKTTGEIDYDNLIALAKTHKPKIILAGFSGYPARAGLWQVCRGGQSVRPRYAPHGRYGTHRRPNCGRCCQESVRLRLPRHHDDDTQDAPWPTWGAHPQQGYCIFAAQSTRKNTGKHPDTYRPRYLPWNPGWPAHAHDCSEGSRIP